jgi:hypothetical protein
MMGQGCRCEHPRATALRPRWRRTVRGEAGLVGWRIAGICIEETLSGGVASPQELGKDNQKAIRATVEHAHAQRMITVCARLVRRQ